MDAHEVAHIDSTPTGVLLRCRCGHEAEAPSRRQADLKHAHHQHIEENRALLARGDEDESEG